MLKFDKTYIDTMSTILYRVIQFIIALLFDYKGTKVQICVRIWVIEKKVILRFRVSPLSAVLVTFYYFD
jgi:hypothetical protein